MNTIKNLVTDNTKKQLVEKFNAIVPKDRQVKAFANKIIGAMRLRLVLKAMETKPVETVNNGGYTKVRINGKEKSRKLYTKFGQLVVAYKRQWHTLIFNDENVAYIGRVLKVA